MVTVNDLLDTDRQIASETVRKCTTTVVHSQFRSKWLGSLAAHWHNVTQAFGAKPCVVIDSLNVSDELLMTSCITCGKLFWISPKLADELNWTDPSTKVIIPDPIYRYVLDGLGWFLVILTWCIFGLLYDFVTFVELCKRQVEAEGDTL